LLGSWWRGGWRYRRQLGRRGRRWTIFLFRSEYLVKQ
jgi:hypothetical protein